jgi:hypothetical protein
VQLGNGCTGSIVGPHTVLTAGHCLFPRDVRVFGIPTPYEVFHTHPHPDYAGIGAYDLRLVYTLEELPKPYAQLGSAGDDAYMLVQGYGVGSIAGLHERQVWECSRSDGVIITTPAVCSGDSGGPLYTVDATGQPRQIGVTSFGFGEPPLCVGASGFVDLNYPGHIEWIQEHTL